MDKSKHAVVDEISRILPTVRSLQQALTNTAANSNDTQAAAAAADLSKLLKAAVKELQHQLDELMLESYVRRKRPYNQLQWERVALSFAVNHPQGDQSQSSHVFPQMQSEPGICPPVITAALRYPDDDIPAHPKSPQPHKRWWSHLVAWCCSGRKICKKQRGPGSPGSPSAATATPAATRNSKGPA